ncbi:MAG: hypothetical protein A3J65_02695 [Candidatus Buchananbacteria bacterium RIFCSPHIGHO2_02_FULL_45_11b]|uniref:Uncharacterized protein n=4 Tax=Candidatus Buchananiibacteriota TaxID=1817903 RepID=A0A1G1YHF0_9BACT|nr:MAG: hypothetical protein A2663_01540 [Candidatus Buchananbacteria bacterium RIFCSPHIGHO2_01_FULL_46_12]OGY51216.1 MAG: hypothetical protein A3J65_02695 [Candidatus Buchananbacteria bacterium RIFCSPHIGHO2_02_FULL_45_11b]OGY52780.1 MAG: hypothetical protein A3B15_03610 [Candidatus Buchananbacteria bacterium RIFCSPLOWO2_01_FULL_45_31]OGY58321.1 MAG: hypothetical protein A3H67_00870 [Candidatus Buchananbacteria bacterium RIFCSPLOWO2_02_FULL_46_11b]
MLTLCGKKPFSVLIRTVIEKHFILFIDLNREKMNPTLKRHPQFSLHKIRVVVLKREKPAGVLEQ